MCACLGYIVCVVWRYGYGVCVCVDMTFWCLYSSKWALKIQTSPKVKFGNYTPIRFIQPFSFTQSGSKFGCLDSLPFFVFPSLEWGSEKYHFHIIWDPLWWDFSLFEGLSYFSFFPMLEVKITNLKLWENNMRRVLWPRSWKALVGELLEC